jgi:hypothetical protein
VTDPHQEYFEYDRSNGVVSSFEVYFTETETLGPTVRHFERYPKLDTPDGKTVTPDFAVVFNDGTMLCGEIARISREEKSVTKLRQQVTGYAALRHGPVGRDAQGAQVLAPVSAVDVLILTPADTQHAMCDRLAATYVEDADSPLAVRRPSIVGYSYDDARAKLVFNLMSRADTPPLRSHGRAHSLASWFAKASDTISCPASTFAPVAAAHRFINDRPPALYVATVLWQDVLPHFRTKDDNSTDRLELAPADIATEMRRRYGFGDAKIAKLALEFLQTAGLATPRADDWVISHKEIAKGDEADVRSALLERSTRPVKHRRRGTAEELADEKARKANAAVQARKRESGQLSLDDAVEDPGPVFSEPPTTVLSDSKPTLQLGAGDPTEDEGA